MIDLREIKIGEFKKVPIRDVYAKVVRKSTNDFTLTARMEDTRGPWSTIKFKLSEHDRLSTYGVD